MVLYGNTIRGVLQFGRYTAKAMERGGRKGVYAWSLDNHPSRQIESKSRLPIGLLKVGLDHHASHQQHFSGQLR